MEIRRVPVRKMLLQQLNMSNPGAWRTKYLTWTMHVQKGTVSFLCFLLVSSTAKDFADGASRLSGIGRSAERGASASESWEAWTAKRISGCCQQFAWLVWQIWWASSPVQTRRNGTLIHHETTEASFPRYIKCCHFAEGSPHQMRKLSLASLWLYQGWAYWLYWNLNPMPHL